MTGIFRDDPWVHSISKRGPPFLHGLNPQPSSMISGLTSSMVGLRSLRISGGATSGYSSRTRSRISVVVSGLDVGYLRVIVSPVEEKCALGNGWTHWSFSSYVPPRIASPLRLGITYVHLPPGPPLMDIHFINQGARILRICPLTG